MRLLVIIFVLCSYTLSAQVISGTEKVRLVKGDTVFQATVSSLVSAGMVYPGAGIPNSTGSAWETSYSTTGSGTVVALATGPQFTRVGIGQAADATQSLMVSGNAWVNGNFYSTNYLNITDNSLGILFNQDGNHGVAISASFNSLNGIILKGSYNNNTVIAPARDDANNYGDVVIRGGGADRVTVKAIGNVGIGTATPGYKMEIVGNTYMNGLLSVGDVPNSNYRVFSYSSTHIGAGYFYVGAGNGGGNNTIYGIVAQSSSATTVNNVGIFATAASTATRNIAGNFQAQDATYNIDLLLGTQTKNQTASYSIYSASGNPSYFAGNVGIGTTSPGAKLHAYSSTAGQILASGYASSVSTANVSNGEILLGETADYQGRISYDGGSGGDMYIDNRWNNDNGDIFFRTKTAATAVNALTIKGSGNVGIGTTSPATKLVVTASTASVTPNANTILFLDSNGGGAMEIATANNVASHIFFSDPQAAAGRITYYHSSDDLSFGTNGISDRVVLNTNGFLGVGATTPRRKTDILDASNPQLRLTNVDNSIATDIKVNSSSNTVFTPLQNSTSAFNFTNAAGTSLLNLNTTNNKVSFLNGNPNGYAYNFGGAPTGGAFVGFLPSSVASGDIIFYYSRSTELSGNLEYLQFRQNATGSFFGSIINENNTSSSAHASLNITTTGANSGDPYIGLTVSGVLGYTLGVDNSDSDKFKISNSLLGSGDLFTLTSTGSVGINTTQPAQKLHIKGQVQIDTLTATPTRIIGADANGVLGALTLGGGLTISSGRTVLADSSATNELQTISIDSSIVGSVERFGITTSINSSKVYFDVPQTTGLVSGSGTTNRLAMWSSSSALTHSYLRESSGNIILDNGSGSAGAGNMSINTNSATGLSITQDISTSQALQTGLNASSTNTNVGTTDVAAVLGVGGNSGTSGTAYGGWFQGTGANKSVGVYGYAQYSGSNNNTGILGKAEASAGKNIGGQFLAGIQGTFSSGVVIGDSLYTDGVWGLFQSNSRANHIKGKLLINTTADNILYTRIIAMDTATTSNRRSYSFGTLSAYGGNASLYGYIVESGTGALSSGVNAGASTSNTGSIAGLYANGSSSSSGVPYGVYASASKSVSGGSLYGIYAVAGSDSTNTRYGTYVLSNGANSGSTKYGIYGETADTASTSIAGYFKARNGVTNVAGVFDAGSDGTNNADIVMGTTTVTGSYGILQAPTGSAKSNILKGKTKIGDGNAPSYELDVAGSIKVSGAHYTSGIATVTTASPYAISATDYYIRIDASSGNQTYTLPAATLGRTLIFKRMDDGQGNGYTVTLTGTVDGTVNPVSNGGGSPTALLQWQYGTLTLIANGTSWDRINQ